VIRFRLVANESLLRLIKANAAAAANSPIKPHVTRRFRFITILW